MSTHNADMIHNPYGDVISDYDVYAAYNPEVDYEETDRDTKQVKSTKKPKE